MYLRTTRRKNKDGSVVEYYQLAHNERHPVTGNPVAKIIHNFGHTDQLDREDLVRLCRSIARVCNLTVVDPYSSEQDQETGKASALPRILKIDRTVMLGTVLTIEALWERVGLKKTFEDIARAERDMVSYERALLAMVANRFVHQSPNWASGIGGWKSSICHPVMG